MTDANGDYNATGVSEGDASVDIDESTLPAGSVQTEGTDPTTVTVTAGQDNTEENNGFIAPGTLRGHIYHDENGNGTQDSGEINVPNITVNVIDANGTVHTVETNATGDYIVTGLSHGNAVANIDDNDPDIPAGAVQTEGDDPTTNVLIIGGQNNTEENNGFNVAPIAEDDTASTLIDTSVSIPVLNNDHDYDGERVMLSAVSPTANGGSVTWDANGTVIYTPALGYLGTDTFEYTIRDNFGSEDNATVTIMITDPDDPLSNAVTAVADSASTEVDTSVDIRVLENDYDLEGHDFNISDFNTTTANGGSITLNDNGTSLDPSDDYLTYTPASGFEGDDVFVYEITDENGAVDRAIVVVRVSSEAVDPDANPVPNAAADAGMTDQDLAITIDVLGNDTHPEGDTLTVIATTDPANGSVVIESNGSITYTPNTGFVGYDTFMYTIEDENGDIATAAVTVGVVAAPDLMIGDATVNEGDDLLFDVNISHPYGADINLTLVTTDITAMDGDDYDGTPITVTIPAGETGVQVLIPTVEDTTYEVDENMSIAVQSIDAGSVGEHSDTGTGTILDDDPIPSVLIGDVSETEGDVLSFEVNLTNPSYEDINITFTTSDGSATMTDNDYTATTVTALVPAGSTDVTVDVPTISDGYVESDETMTLAVIAVNSGTLDDTTDIGTGTIENDDVGPTANDDTTTGVTGEDISINVIGNDSDGTSNLDPSSVRIIDPDTGDEVTELSVPGEGTWSVDGGVVTFVPEDGFTGDPAPIEYTVQDIWGNEDVASLTVDYPPVARDDNATGELNEIVNLDILANDDNTSKPLDPLSVVITDASGTMIGDGKTVVVSGEGSWIVEDNGTITFEPEFDFAGDTTPIYYTVSEENVVGPIDTSNPAKVTVQYPELVDDVWNTSDDPGTPQTVPVLDNDAPGIDPSTVMIIDPDTNATTDILVVEGEGTWSVDPSTGEITFEPEAEFVFDPSPVTYIAEYNGEETNIATLIVNYPLLARDDEKLDNDYGTVVTLADLYNDNGDINSSSVELHLPDGFMDTHPDAQMSDDNKLLVVPGQGDWIVNDDGTIMFVPEVGFEDDPTPIEYSVADNSGARSNFATLVVTYCDSPQASDSGDALSSFGILLMGLLTGLVGLYFVRKEEESRGY